ncbi:MOSC domain-containing protein [Rhodobacteraceae bacterium]|nr:MOSC domain-containing protein [Paracoccaceae bacterium]
MADLVQIWRHPIKAHGFEALQASAIKANETLPWDRVWAATHEASRAKTGAWVSCANFSRGAKAPHLMAISATLDTDTAQLTLQHPDHGALTFRPDEPQDVARFVDWIAPLMPSDRAATTGLIRATEQGMTDTPFPSISIGNLATLRVLEQRAGQTLDVRRFRINIWVEDLAPFEEFEWVGKDLKIADTAFHAEDRITRCSSTMANPDTGKRDADPVAVMDTHWGHHDFGIALIAQTDGHIAIGDKLALTS